MLTGRRYLLALTAGQSEQAERFGAICRAVWNTGLEQRREYRRRGVQMAEAKKDPYCAWLADAPSHILQQTLRDLEKACKTHGTWKVRWRCKAKTPPAFRFPDPKHIRVERLNRRWGQVRLPKLGWVRLRWTRPLGGTIRNATVSGDGGRWYICFCVEDGLQQRLARSQRVHGRNRRSKRRDAVRVQLGRLNARIRARRTDFAVQTAHDLVTRHGLVAVEDLRTRNMTRSAKGTAEQPGVNVRQIWWMRNRVRAKRVSCAPTAATGTTPT